MGGSCVAHCTRVVATPAPQVPQSLAAKAELKDGTRGLLRAFEERIEVVALGAGGEAGPRGAAGCLALGPTERRRLAAARTLKPPMASLATTLPVPDDASTEDAMLELAHASGLENSFSTGDLLAGVAEPGRHLDLRGELRRPRVFTRM